jgi:hypothetical protein
LRYVGQVKQVRQLSQVREVSKDFTLSSSLDNPFASSYHRLVGISSSANPYCLEKKIFKNFIEDRKRKKESERERERDKKKKERKRKKRKSYIYYILLAVIPSVAWDFLFDKHLPHLPQLTHLPNLT